MSPLVRRIISGLGANFFGQGVTILIQLLSVPIFLHYWDPATYGEWLMLSAVPAYFSMADVGLVAVAANKMTMLTARGEHAASNRVFQSALVMTIMLISTFAIVAIAATLLIKVDVLAGTGRKMALLMLIGVAFANVFSGLFDAVFRAAGKYALGTYALNFARMLESLLGLGFLVLGYGFAGVAFGFLLGRLLASLGIWVYSAQTFKDFVWRSADAQRDEIKSLIRPAIAFMAFPAGNAISIQGMSLLVGSLFGPAFLAVFNTYRTLSRVLVQLITTVSRSVWPEISRLYGAGEYAKIRRLSRFGTLGVGVASVLMAVLLYVFAEWILLKWTHGKIGFDPALFTLFLAATVATAFWQLAMVVTMATNTHERLSWFYLGASVAVIAIATTLSGPVGAYASAWALLIFEIVMFCASHKVASRVLNGDRGLW